MRWRATALAVLIASAAPTVAVAQSREDARAARDLYNDGKALYEKGDYAAAAQKFIEAYGRAPRAELLYNIGQAYRLAGQLTEAESYLQQYLAADPEGPNVDAVVDAIVEIQAEIAAQQATVDVETNEPGRAVHVGDEVTARCQTPCSVTLAPGPHRIVVKGGGVADYVRELTLEAGTTTKIVVDLETVGRGALMVTTDRPAGTLRVGDVTAALPLQEPVMLPTGAHEVRVDAARGASWSGNVNVAEAETTELFVPMQAIVEARRAGSLRRSFAYGLWGGAAAALGGGLLLGSQAQRSYDALQAQSVARGAVDESLREQGRDQQFGANLLFGVATGAVLTGAGLFLWDLLAGERDPTP